MTDFRDPLTVEPAGPPALGCEVSAEDQLRDLYDRAAVGLCLLDRDFRVLRINRPLAQTSAAPGEELRGRSVDQLWPDWAPRLREALARVIDTGEPIVDWEVRHRIGAEASPRTWRVCFSPLFASTSGDRVAGLQGQIVDATAANALAGLDRVEAADGPATHHAAELFRSQHHRDLALAAAHLGAWDFDFRTGELTLDPTAAALLGLPAGTPLAASRLASQIDARDLPQIQGQMRDAVGAQSAGECDVEFRLASPEKSPRWVRSVGRVLFREAQGPVDRSGPDAEAAFSSFGTKLSGRSLPPGPHPAPTRAADRFIGVVMETTDRRQAELATRRSELRYRQLVQSFAEVTFIANAHGDFTRPQPRFETFTGLSLDAYCGRRWIDAVHPDDRPRLIAALDQSHRLGDLIELECRLHRQSTGQYCWIQLAAVLIGSDESLPGRPGYQEWVGMMVDISRRHSAESRLTGVELQQRMAMTAAEMGSWQLDESTGLRELDSRMAEILALPPGPIVEPAEVWFDRIDPADRQWVRDEFDRQMTGQRRLDLSFRIARGAEQTRWVRCMARPHDGEVANHRWLGAVIDITKEKLAEQSLRTAKSQAESANRTKSEFLANISHEFRTPMTAILGYCDLISMEDDVDVREQMIDTIRRNGEHLLEIISDVLDLSKIEAGRLPIVVTTFDPAQVVAEVVSGLRVRAQEKNLALRWAVAADAPARIDSDRTRLRQILINLVGNALKFTESGCVDVVLRAVGEGRYVEIQVRDTGPGLSDELLARLFESFVQADESDTRPHGGTGLGLAICSRLARLLGGDVTVHSRLGEGSTFVVRLAVAHSKSTRSPLRAGRAVPPNGDVAPQLARSMPSAAHSSVPGQATGTTAPLATPPSPLPLRGHCILVVDDHRDIRFVARHFLQRLGGEVSTAGDGQQAIELIEQHDFDVVLMDCQMPITDGFTAVRHLRSAGVQLPIIAITANAMSDDRQRCLAAGFTDYLTKPLDQKSLTQMMGRWVQPRA